MNMHLESCLVCGLPLEYLDQAQDFTCHTCGKNEAGHVRCPRGHFVCETCHGGGFMAELPDLLARSSSTSPVQIAEELLAHPELPMLGCEHAHIAAGALMQALINRADTGVDRLHLQEALQRTARQAVSAYCGLSGVCGVVPALGSVHSVLVGGQCGRGAQTRSTMKLVSLLAAATAGEADPGCCKAYVRRCLLETTDYLETTLGLSFPGPPVLACRDMERHPHGCRGPACSFHPKEAAPPAPRDPDISPPSKEKPMSTAPAAQARYDEFFGLAYTPGALDERTKILVSLGASLAAGCVP